jgi:TolA-binding protein
VKARILYAQAELARMLRKNEETAAALDSICDKIPPAALGAALLAQSGDRLLERNQPAQALKFYKELTQSFPKSDLLEYAYNGQGQIALMDHKAEAAMGWFNDAIDKAGASVKLRDVTLGKAKAFIKLGKFDEAKPILEQVASTREWRGECTAEAVFLLGEIQAQKNDMAGAIQFFQRVFVAYQKYGRFVGRAYLRAAECFEKLNEPEKAAAHYRELATKPRLSSLPEVQTARQRLAAQESK